MVFQLDDNPTHFPDPKYGDEDGLLAVGGDLSVDRLLFAYCNGIFPWYGFKEREQIMWWCPRERFVIFPKEIHISHSMRQLMRKGQYELTVNEAFEDVIHECSVAQQRDRLVGAWLGEDMIEAYRELYYQQFAASVEVWERPVDDAPRRLVGGLYGVNIGRNFFGESMFSLVPSASKLALIHLAGLMESTGGIIDCQFETPHLRSMGGRHISYEEYMEYLNYWE